MKKDRLEIVIGLLFVAAVVAGVYFLVDREPQVKISENPVPREVSQPVYSPAIAAALEKSTGFQHLVSYTGEAFEPSNLLIQKGDVVRFVNNSMDLLWVASTGDGGQVYPGQDPDCGQSDFDSCVLVQAGTFWEFAFDLPGEWTYKNNANVTRSGIISVIVQ